MTPDHGASPEEPAAQVGWSGFLSILRVLKGPPHETTILLPYEVPSEEEKCRCVGEDTHFLQSDAFRVSCLSGTKIKKRNSIPTVCYFENVNSIFIAC